MGNYEWKSICEKPTKIGTVALRIQTTYGEQIAHQVVIGHALADKFAFQDDQFAGIESIAVTHWIELPEIPGLDRYFREVTK